MAAPKRARLVSVFGRHSEVMIYTYIFIYPKQTEEVRTLSTFLV